MAFELRDGFKVPLTVSAVDAEGNVAAVDSNTPFVWTSSDEAIATVDADGLVTTTEGPGVGEVTITATGDADLGEGVTPITATFVVNVTAGAAAVLTVTAGDPVPR